MDDSVHSFIFKNIEYDDFGTTRVYHSIPNINLIKYLPSDESVNFLLKFKLLYFLRKSKFGSKFQISYKKRYDSVVCNVTSLFLKDDIIPLFSVNHCYVCNINVHKSGEHNLIKVADKILYNINSKEYYNFPK